MSDTEKKATGNRNLYLTAGTLGLLFAGIIYAWSILKTPFSEEFGWSNAQLATAYTVTINLFCIGCLLGGFLVRRLGPKIPVIAGAVLVGIGFFMTSRLDGNSIILLYIFYGVFSGLGIGIAYNTILAAVGSWFPDKKGFASGIMMMGFGASTLIIGNIAASLMGSASLGWRGVYLLLAACTCAALVITGLIIKMPDAETVKALAGNTAADSRETPAPKGEDIATADMLKRISFWKFFIAMTLLGAAGASLISFARDFSISVGTPVATAGLFVGVLSVANGIGRIVAGIIYDKYGIRAIVWYIGIMEVCSCLVCVAAALTHSVPLCLIGFLLVGLSYGGNTNAVSVIITSFYGTKFYAQNLSFGLLTMLPSSYLAKFSTTLLDMSGGYIVPFLVLAVYGALATVLNVSNKKA